MIKNPEILRFSHWPLGFIHLFHPPKPEIQLTSLLHLNRSKVAQNSFQKIDQLLGSQTRDNDDEVDDANIDDEADDANIDDE